MGNSTPHELSIMECGRASAKLLINFKGFSLCSLQISEMPLYSRAAIANPHRVVVSLRF